MIHQKAKMMGKIGVDRSEELKKQLKRKTILKTEIGKNWKSKTVEQRKPMNSKVIREISPEDTSAYCLLKKSKLLREMLFLLVSTRR